MPLPRFRIRMLMIAVAVIGVPMGAERYRRRREYCLVRASYHRHYVSFWCGNHIAIPIGYSRPARGQRSTPPDDDGKLQGVRARDMHIDWHWRLAERFEYAARHPWSALPDEPPCPGYDYFYRLNVAMGLIANP